MFKRPVSSTYNRREELRQEISAVINTEIVADKTVREVERIFSAIQAEIQKRGGMSAAVHGLSESIGIQQDVAIAAMAVWKTIGHYRYTDKGEKLTVREMNALVEQTSKQFVVCHIANYTAYTVLQDMYDWLVDKKYIGKFSKSEGYWRKADAAYKDYREKHLGGTERSAVSLFDDHVRMSFDNVSDQIDMLGTVIRDYLIQKRREFVAAGQKDDITLLTKTAVCMALMTFMQLRFKTFFLNIVQEHGVDFSSDFRYADLRKMAMNAVNMCEALGVKYSVNADGDTVLLGIDLNKNLRVSNVWNSIIRTLDDADLADETAKRALDCNPVARQNYKEIMDEFEREKEEKKRQEMEEGFKQLGEIFKVTKTD